MPIETLVYENQQQYYDASNKAEKDASSTVFIEFMLNMMLQTIEKFDIGNSSPKMKEEYLKLLTKSEKEVLSTLIIYFNKNEFIDIDTAVSILNKNKSNIRKYFGKFMKSGILIPIGENKGRKYEMNKDILF